MTALTRQADLAVQLQRIENAEHEGKPTVKLDGHEWPVAEAEELTRAALYEVEVQLQAEGHLP